MKINYILSLGCEGFLGNIGKLFFKKCVSILYNRGEFIKKKLFKGCIIF